MDKNKNLAALLASLMAASLVACGGGGGGGDDDPPGGGDDEDASGAGIWGGSFRVDGLGTGQPMGGIVTEEGDFAFATVGSTAVRLHFGTGTTNGKSFTAAAKTYTGSSSVTSSFMGTINDGVSITGSYSFTGESALFNLAYDSTYVRPASLAKLPGTYTLTSAASGSTPATTLTVTVIDSGNFLYINSTSGCTISGDFTVPHANRNYYRWTGIASACPAGDGNMVGVAFLADTSAGQNKQLVMLGRHQTASAAIFLAAAKP